MSTILQKLSNIAVEAAGVPFADPGLVAQINEATVRIAEAQKKTEGMDLALVRAGAHNLRLGRGKGRGSEGEGGGRGLGDWLEGIVEKVVADGISNLVWHGVGRWLDSVGVGPDEKEREEGQGKQGDNADELCTSVDKCCDAIEEVSATSDLAVEAILDLVAVFVRLCSGGHPALQMAATLLPLVKDGLDYVRGTVEDRNECIERCLSECEARCRDAQEHQPKPAPEFCDSGAPKERETPCDPPRGDEPKGPVTPEPQNPQNPQDPQPSPCPTHQADAGQVGGHSEPKPGLGATQTMPASAAPPSFTAMAGVPGAVTVTADVNADIKADIKADININLNANTSPGAQTDLAAAGDLATGICSLTQGLQLPSPQTFAASLAQALAAAGCETGQVPAEQPPVESPTEDGCEEEAGKQPESTEKSCCGQDCTCCTEDAPEPEPESEPCPEPEPEPEPEATATEGPVLGEGTFSPPPELAEVPEPPAPAEKLTAGTQPAAVSAPADAQAAPVADPTAPETAPAPAEPAEPGEDARIKKTSGW